MAAAFYIIYQDPTSEFNPFPPRTPVVEVNPPEDTRTQVVLPEIWTPLPEDEGYTELAMDPADDQTGEWQSGSDPSGIATSTPVLIITPKPKTSSSNNATGQKYSGVILPTKNPLEQVSTVENDDQVLSVIAPVGVFDNTWQNIQAIPAFAWSATVPSEEIDHFQLYFGTKQNGKLTIRTTKMNYSWKAVKSGIYYLRLVAVAKSGRIVGKPASFLFKFDNTPPRLPEGFVTGSDGDTGYPYFEWTASTDANSGMNGGYAGYSIYQGTVKKCGKAVAFTSDTHWTPVVPVEKGTTQYFCVRALDVVGNFTNWVGPVEYTYYN